MTSEIPTKATFDPPREGLPPCLSLAIFDGRGASLRDSAACDADHSGAPRFWITGGRVKPCDCPTGHRIHPEVKWHYFGGSIGTVNTDDPAEAEAAWERAERWVRTGDRP